MHWSEMHELDNFIIINLGIYIQGLPLCRSDILAVMILQIFYFFVDSNCSFA